MTEPNRTRVRIGKWLLEPALNRIRNDVDSITLEPRAAEVLEYLARHPRQVVSVDDLVDNVWNRRFVGDSPVYRTIADIRRQLGDDARHPEYIETIRKRGYRLVADVEWIDQEPATPGTDGSTTEVPPSTAITPATSTRSRWPALVAAAAALFVAGFYWLSRDRLDEHQGNATVAPIVAVVPFENLSSDGEDYVVRGLTDAIATRLSSVAELRVISQNSTRQFSNSAATAKTIGEQLGAAYLVTGSALRQSGSDADRLRVNAHLVDAATERYLWSQTYDEPLSDVFDVQASIAERVAQELDVTLLAPGRADRLREAALDAPVYQRYLRGREALSRGWEENDLEQAVTEFAAVVELNPEFAPALASLGLAHLQLYAQYWDRSPERLELAREMIDRALEIDPELTEGHFGLGSYYLRREMLQPAFDHLSRVRRDNPSHTDALAAIAQIYQRRGELRSAVDALDAASRFDPLNHRLLYMLGQTQMVTGDYADAELALERAITLRPELLEGYLFKAALYMSWRGDQVLAEAEFQRAAAELGMGTVVEWLLQPGVSGSFRFAGPEYGQALEDWTLDGSDADPAAYYLALAERAEVAGREAESVQHYDQARQLLEVTVEEIPDEPFFYALLGSAYAGAGMTAEAVETGQRLLELAPVDENPWDNADYLWYMAEIYVLAGMVDEAIAQVEIALQYPTTLSRAWISVEPFWDPLRDDPRFQALLAAEP